MSPDETKAHGNGLTQDSAEYAGAAQPAYSLLSGNSDDSLGDFSVNLSIIHGTDMIILGDPFFPSHIFP